LKALNCFRAKNMKKKDKVKSNDKIVTSKNNYISRHPMATYYVLVFVISWGCIFAAIGPSKFIGTSQMSGAQQPFVYLATLAGPSIAGILSAIFVYGRAGLKDIRSRLFKWRVGIRWYMVALLTAPILMTGILTILSLTPVIVSSPDKATLLISGIVVGLVVGFFEELGWSGFAVPQLRKSYGFLTTGLIVGLLWGVWHFPLFSGSATTSGEVPVLYLAVLLFSWLPAYRVLMVWVYDSTNSLLLMILMHFPIVVGQFVLLPTVISGGSVIAFDLVFAAALLWIIAAIVVLRRRKASKAVKKQSI
jgi:membrane protease YdiL (CAAX protease family)